MNKPPLSWLLVYQRLAGVCDLSTGILLMFLPYQTLRLMHFQHPEDFASPAGVSMIGAFVLSTGLIYLVTARFPRQPHEYLRLSTTMLITACTRLVIALFLAGQLARGVMDWPWLTVAATDGSMALWQTYGLLHGWWQPGDSAV